MIIKIIFIAALSFIYIINPLFIYWGNILDNKYFAELYIGIPGTGKTALCNKFIVQNNIKKEYNRVYSNFELPGAYLYNINDVRYHKYKFMPNSLVLIDEAGVNLSNREFKNIDKDFLHWIAFLRHNQCRVKFFSQSADIDKKARDICQCYHILSRWFVFTLDRVIIKKVDIGKDANGIGTIIETYEKMPIIGGLHFHYLPRYIGLWDSYDYINVPLIPSRYILPSPKFLIASSKFKWYKKNFAIVYSDFIGRVAATKSRLYNKYFYNIIYISKFKFDFIQRMQYMERYI